MSAVGFTSMLSPGPKGRVKTLPAACRSKQSGLRRSGESVHEWAHGIVGLGVAAIAGLEPHVGVEAVVGNIAGSGEEEMLAHINRLDGMDGNGDQFARSIAGRKRCAPALRPAS
jgi:hypothetical protein